LNIADVYTVGNYNSFGKTIVITFQISQHKLGVDDDFSPNIGQAVETQFVIGYSYSMVTWKIPSIFSPEMIGKDQISPHKV